MVANITVLGAQAVPMAGNLDAHKAHVKKSWPATSKIELLNC
jgi:hypothetical protein